MRLAVPRSWLSFITLAWLAASITTRAQSPGPLPGMPPLVDPQDVYAGARVGQLSPVTAGFLERIYVPISGRDIVQVIDPHT
ncbi:MAG: hypothetical protein ABL961_12640, partial [Vicinamibacterales bacterium]